MRPQYLSRAGIAIRLSLGAIAALLAVVAAEATAVLDSYEANGRATSASPEEVLAQCLRQRYGYDFIEEIRIVQREDSSGAERVTRLQMLQKTIDERVHNLVRFTYPAGLRGTRVLTIEREDRSDDHFAFMKSQQKIRRVRSRRGDSFVGTDFSMEDLEKREVSDFEVLAMRTTEIDGEPVYAIAVEPLYDSGYFRLEYLVAKKDFANLGIRYFKEGADKPFKELIVPRETMKEFRKGLHLGLHAYVRDHRRETETHVYLDKVLVDPAIDDALFTSSSLHLDRSVPGLD